MSRADQQAQTRARRCWPQEPSCSRGAGITKRPSTKSPGAPGSPGEFYANFQDKGDLFLTILEAQRKRDFGQLSNAVDDAPEEEVPPESATG